MAATDPAMPSPAAQAPLAYGSRRSVLENEATWTLAPQMLERAEHTSEGGVAMQRLPYSEVAEVQLSYDPTRFDSRRFRCDLRSRAGHRLVLVSTSYVSVGDFEDRGSAYAPFVRELVRRIGQAAPDCRFRAGKRPWVFWAEHVFLLGMLLLLASVLAYVGDVSWSGLVGIKLAILVCYVPIAIQYAKRNRPRRLIPDKIPSEVLP
jgi:hypothetical protein